MLESYASLLLAHLIADFPLQTNLVYRLKSASNSGIALHAFIHVLTTFILTGARWDKWAVWLFLLGSHYFIDWAKLQWKATSQSTGFLIDQLTHLMVLFLVALWQPDLMSILPPWVFYLTFVYAWLPAVLMYLWVYANEMTEKLTQPSSRLVWMRQNLLRISHQSGFVLLVPSALAVFLVLFS